MKQIFLGADLFDGERIIKDHALVLEDGLIKALVPFSERPHDSEIIDLAGGILSPGFIDIQVNGGGGTLFNEDPTLEGIAAIADAHRRFGTTALLPTVITDHQKIIDDALRATQSAREIRRDIAGIHVEGPFIDVVRKGAHPANYIRALTQADIDHFAEARSGVLLLTVAPNKVTADQITALTRAGIHVSLGHSDATDLEAKAAIDAGARAVTHLFNAMSQCEGRAPGLVGSALADPRVICGLIADGHHVAPTAIIAALAAKGAEGIALISDAMPSAAGGPVHFTLQSRLVRRQNKKLTLDDGTLAGADITMFDAVNYMLSLGIPLAYVLQMATRTPARLIGLEGQIGALRPGYPADIVHLGPDHRLLGVFYGGKRLD
ncbi:MAG: N-acetylglucosamine-6-phosphate deacetylase [Alphaproteobacteria bacterium]|nr:N-acetylglucosamine-6-phosphate deacetylase [Alphaproteobacteria bacterium]